MVVRVEYHISKKDFLKNKVRFKKILQEEAFQISMLKFEKGMTELEIAQQTGISYFKIRKMLSFVCERKRIIVEKTQ